MADEHGGLGSISGGGAGAAPSGRGWRSGGTLHPSRGGTHYETEETTREGGSQQPPRPQQQRQRHHQQWTAGAVPRAARAAGKGAGSGAAGTRLQPDNVGFKLLQKQGWNAGEGLGKDGVGIVEPLKVWKKGNRRGVGGESKNSGHVVGEEDPGGDNAPAKRTNARGRDGGKGPGGKSAPGGDDDDDDDDDNDDDPKLSISKDQMAAHMRKTARERAIATHVFRAFKEEEPGVDMNPLLRLRREEQEEAERRKQKRKREKGGGGGGGGGADGMSANNPLRGLW